MMVPPPLLPVLIVVGTGDRCANQACRHGGSGEARAPIDRASRLVRLFEHPSSFADAIFAEIASALRRP
jgi:hypothetical protein